ncbi:MAG: protein kinase [Labilithrix sp.]|nr:protein kinase [Labilithrix sp.]
MHGPYALYDALQALGSGAAASVHLGVARGATTLPVAIKRLHAGQARQPAAVARLLDEVRLTKNIVHPNVVRTIDFVSDGEEMLAIMEYVHGEPLSRLLGDASEHRQPIPVPIAARIAIDVLCGLAAAHQATDAEGRPLLLVHRDVTPENILVGADGMARLMDFGVAKAEGRLHATHDGGVRGKLAYLAPEQIGGEVSPRTDLYAVGLVLWEMLVGVRAITGENEGELLVRALDPHVPPASHARPDVPPLLDAAIARALAKEPEHRFASATEQAEAFQRAAVLVANAEDVSAWVGVHGGARLALRAENVNAMLAAEHGAIAHGALLATAPPGSSVGRLVVPDGAFDPAASYPSYGGAPLPAEIEEEAERPALLGLAMMVAAALLVLGLGLMWRARSEPAPPTEAELGAMPAPLVTTVTTAVVAAPTATIPDAIPASALPAAEPTGVSLVAAPTGARRPGNAGSVPTTKRATARASCDPPWTLDANGIRRYDPACVK